VGHKAERTPVSGGLQRKCRGDSGEARGEGRKPGEYDDTSNVWGMVIIPQILGRHRRKSETIELLVCLFLLRLEDILETILTHLSEIQCPEK
jgi:hypothetical protein